MSELPKGWVETTIGVAALNVNNLREPISLKKRSEIQGQYPYYGATGQIDSLNDFTHEGDHILVGEDGANLLSKSKPLAFIAKGKYWVNNHAHSLRSLANMPSLYICLYINSLDLAPWVTGSAQPKLTRGNLDKIPLPLAPLAEQKRIVEKLDQVLAQVDTIKARLDGIPAILKRFRQSVLAAAVSGKLTEVKSFSSTKFSALILEMKNGLSPKPNEESKGFPILRISSVRPMLIDFEDHRFLDCNSKIVTTYKLAEQDLLFTRYNGSIDFVGVCGLVRNINEKTYLYPDKLIRVRVNRDIISPEFIEIYFSAYEIRKVITDFIKSTSGQKGISGKDLKSVIIKYPSLEEQTEIVRLVDQYFVFADTIEKQVQKAQQRVDKLTQSILAKAFRGELVPQDPDDEPADQLLNRIAAARAESEALAKAAKKVGKRK